MSTPRDPRREYPSTYLVQDRSSEEELTRLLIQDQMATTGMGGVLPEQPDPTVFRQVLDVGCGPGSWLREAARTYPSMSVLAGVDISGKMVEYARMQAETEGLSDQVKFYVMDALRIIEFPARYFDLVNHRSAASWLRTWEWPGLLQEYRRVCRPRGVIRVTEADFTMESSSQAVNRLYSLFLQALYRAGHYFTPEGNGVISQLADLLQRSGLQNVQTRSCRLEYRAGTAEWQGFVEDGKHLFRTVAPFLRKWTAVPDDYESIYQQMLFELQQPDSMGAVEVVTAWGINPK